MLFKRIYDDDLAQASYFLGCQATNTAVVVDPRRDIQVYLDEAEHQHMTIVAVTETHIHADYLSGARELAHATGATLYLSDEGGEDWHYRFAHEGLKDGSEITLGNIILKAVHTPGHTPEHLSFLVIDGATASEPGFILTGDFVFVGDLGRPDLLDEAAGGVDTRFEGSRELFASLKRFVTLPDYLQVWPGHGAGSACGKALGAVASSTVGYERRFAWWAGYLQNDEAGFVEALLEGQPDAPHYFGRMKRHNRAGPTILGERPPLERLRPEALGDRLGSELLLIDTRAREEAARDAVAGALNVPAGKTFASYASYVLDPEEDARAVVLLAADAEGAEALRAKLSGIGVDRVTGYLTSLEGLAREPVKTVAPEALGALDDPLILDVRSESEYRAGHIPGARQLHAGRVLWAQDTLPQDRPLVVHCQSGARSAVVASALRAAGFRNVLELEGSFEGWRKAQTVTA